MKPTSKHADPLDPEPTKRNILSFFIWGIVFALLMYFLDHTGNTGIDVTMFAIHTISFGFFSFLVKYRFKMYRKSKKHQEGV